MEENENENYKDMRKNKIYFYKFVSNILILYNNFTFDIPYEPSYFASFFFNSNIDKINYQIYNFSRLLKKNNDIINAFKFEESCNKIYDLLLKKEESFTFISDVAYIGTKLKFKLIFIFVIQNNKYVLNSVDYY